MINLNSMYKNLLQIPILILLVLFSNFSIASSEVSKIIKNNNVNVIFLRHAIAPGYGDPDNFKLGDCNTQRNLSVEGREQAKTIGDYFRTNEIKFSEILKDTFNHSDDQIIQLMADLLSNGKISAGKYNYEIAEQKALEAYSTIKLKKIDLHIDIKSL